MSNEKNDDCTPEQSLWRAVILQFYRDLIHNVRIVNRRVRNQYSFLNKEDQVRIRKVMIGKYCSQFKAEAESDDMKFICDMASLNYEEFYQYFLKFYQRNILPKKNFCLNKRKFSVRKYYNY